MPTTARGSAPRSTGSTGRVPRSPATARTAGQGAAAGRPGTDAGDGSRVGPLLDRVDGPVASFTGDGAYDRDDVHAEVAARHPEAAVVAPPNETAPRRAGAG